MKTGIKVGDLMTRNFVHLPPSTDLKTAAKTMTKKSVGSLLLTENNILKGILTEKDIVWTVSKNSTQKLSDIKVSDIMTKKVKTIKPGADITEAMKKFRSKKVRRLPVIEKKKLIGIITANDILKIDPELFQAIAETLKIREENSKISRHEIKARRKYGNCEECGDFEIIYEDETQWICLECYSKR